MEPFLDFTGSKRKIKNIIINKFGKFDIYVEPFLGGGTIYFDLLPKKAILADNNQNLIITYLMVKNNIDNLIKKLRKIGNEYRKSEDKKKYYLKKREFYNKIKYINYEELKDKSEKIQLEIATLFIFINKTSYRGLYRENRNGLFNVGLGNRNIHIIGDKYFNHLREISKNLSKPGIKIMYSDYNNVFTYINKYYKNKKILLYLDPPYYPCNSSFFNYTKIFGVKEQEELAKKIIKLRENLNIEIYMSNSYCKELKILYKSFIFKKIVLSRFISPNKKANFAEYLIYSK